MKTLEELEISPTPWKLIPYGLSTESTDATHGDIVDAIDQPILNCFPIIEDARFMKASPKMYEALREAIIETCHMCDSCSGHPDYECENKESQCFVKKWRAVLAEASGEVSNV